MKVKTELKMGVLGALYPQLFSALAAGTEDGDVTADDVLDFYAMGIAALLDNDSNLRTPRDLRLGAETAAKLVEQRAKEFRAMQDQAGVSWLTVKLEEAQSADRPLQ